MHKAIDDNLSDCGSCLRITEGLKESSLQLRGHSFGEKVRADEDQFQGKEDLQLELRRELVVDHTDKSTANLDNLGLDGLRLAEVNQVLEADGRLDTDIDLTRMSDRVLDH